MKIITQINDKIRELYPNCDARNGIAKQIVNGDDGLRVAIFEDNDEPSVFVPDDEYEIQVAHIINGGRANNDSKFGEMTFTVEMIVISKFVKFYHILDLLNRMNIKAQEFDYNTQSVLKKIGAIEDYPELEAYSISYQFTARPGDFGNC